MSIVNRSRQGPPYARSPFNHYPRHGHPRALVRRRPRPRIAERRKAKGITQVQPAEQLGVAQQTLAHYEGGVSRIAVETLAQASQVLDVSVGDLLGTQAKRSPGKRGPQPKIVQQLQLIEALPKAKQRAISQVLVRSSPRISSRAPQPTTTRPAAMRALGVMGD